MKLTDEKRKINYLLTFYVKKKFKNKQYEYKFTEHSHTPIVYCLIVDINLYHYKITKSDYKKLKSWQR